MTIESNPSAYGYARKGENGMSIYTTQLLMLYIKCGELQIER